MLRWRPFTTYPNAPIFLVQKHSNKHFRIKTRRWQKKKMYSYTTAETNDDLIALFAKRKIISYHQLSNLINL